MMKCTQECKEIPGSGSTVNGSNRCSNSVGMASYTWGEIGLSQWKAQTLFTPYNPPFWQTEV